jgi:hypothetical protein
LPKIFEILASIDVRQLMRRISEDSAYSSCVAINVDECRSLDAIVALPTDREGGISLVARSRVVMPALHSIHGPVALWM